MEQTTLTRQQASAAVGDLGWRFLLGTLRTSVTVPSLSSAAAVVTSAVAACGPDADGHLRADVRASRVVLTLQSLAHAAVTTRDVELARRVTSALHSAGLRAEPAVQVLEIAIDALDIASIRPFWKAVLGYVDEPGAEGPEAAVVDPFGEGPAIWFQQMDQPRPQRNRIHFDICVPHDEARDRIESAVAAGGKVVSATSAPAFWVLSDAEGNEACITTWQGRD
ncbi:VOC family protein [Asanoa sp. NPDC050611]|uniref:VOC family protein n=1 Tax=Asanoa sp. NPDC050611 TaxID=3157098 RepID=UPI0033FD368B